MFYTLLKFLGWGLLLALIGGCVGWALRALKCRGEVARASATTVDPEEVERMRHRLANLEQVVAERDRLRMQVADMRHADSPGVVGAAAVADLSAGEPDPDAPADVDDGTIDDVLADDESAGGVGDELSVEASEVADDVGEVEMADEVNEVADDVGEVADDADDPGDAGDMVDGAGDDGGPPAALDLDAAAATIGKKVKLDDLTTVDGIGPKIAELCNAIGITSWRALADTDVDALQSMLDAAGSRFQVHKPESWPRQASLLANGQWDAFVTFTDELDAGR